MGQVGGGFNGPGYFRVCVQGFDRCGWIKVKSQIKRCTPPYRDFGDGGDCSAHKKRRRPLQGVAFVLTAATAYSDSLYAIT